MVASKLQPPVDISAQERVRRRDPRKSRIVAVSEASKLTGDYLFDRAWFWSDIMEELQELTAAILQRDRSVLVHLASRMMSIYMPCS
jgi:hypothetical protein